MDAERRAAWFARLPAPMDDMWAAFAEMATQHDLTIGDEVVGACAVDDERRLLRFAVDPRFADRATDLLDTALREHGVACMIVATLDPDALGPALDLATRVEPHTLLFAPETEPAGPGFEHLDPAESEDRDRIVDFQVAALGAPRAFLEAYTAERLERREMLLLEEEGRLLCTGELRRDKDQAGIAHLGVIVATDARGRGLATRMLTSLRERSFELGLAPHCSTEVGNLGARKAIERSGFRARHRLLRVEFPS